MTSSLARNLLSAPRITGVDCAFFLFVVLYVLILLSGAELGPGDEFHFLPTLQSGKPIPIYGVSYFETVKFGRFMPLAGQEFNIVALLSNSPTFYLALNAFQLFVFLFLLKSVLDGYTNKTWLVNLVLLLLIVSPGFVHLFFTYLLTDKNVLFYYAIFLYAFLNFQKSGKTAYFLAAFLSANAAIYYKETAFLAVATFALTHLLFSWKEISLKGKLLDGLLVLSGAIFIGIYLIHILPNVTFDLYGGSSVTPGVRFLKNMFNFGFVTDPALILILFPLGAWRLFRVATRRDTPDGILDGMLAAAIIYVLVFFVLNMHGDYYLQPAYVFALPPIVSFISTAAADRKWIKHLAAVVAVVLLVNTMPIGLHSITYHKYVPLNFSSTIDFLANDIKARDPVRRAGIFLYGVGPGVGNGHYYVFGEYLKYKGLPITRFDLKSDTEGYGISPPYLTQSPFDSKSDLDLLNNTYSFQNPRIPYTVFQSDRNSSVQRGDYLVVSPLSGKNIDSSVIDSLQRDYDLVYRTHSSWAIPSISLKTAVKYALSVGLSSQAKSKGYLLGENIFNCPDFYIFIKK